MSLTRRAVAPVLALALGASAATTASASDDWSLERKSSDPALVSARLSKLHRSPFDTRHWAALRKAIGLSGLSKKIKAGLARAPGDVGWRILDARLDIAQGRPGEAADKLAALELAATGKRRGRVFELRVTALERASDWGTLVPLLERRAAGVTDTKAKTKLLVRAFAFAQRGRRSEDALRVAQTLVDLKPEGNEARLRLARAASDADQPALADSAYADAVSRARGRAKLELRAEQARARLAADQAGGAADLLWSMLEDPTQGSRVARETWWSTLYNAHRRARTTDALLRTLGAWLERHDDEAAAWRTLATAQQSSGIDPIDAWTRARALAPRDAETQSALIEALEAKGRHADAVATTRTMMEGPGFDPMTAIELAGNLAAAGERDLAFELASDVREHYGRSAKAMAGLLDFYNLNDDADTALEIATAIVKLSPRKADARVALGEQLFQMRRRDEALEQWAMLPKLTRPSHKGWARFAQVLTEHELHVEAIAAIGKAMAADPSAPEYTRLRAVLAEEQRRPRPALAMWQRTRELSVAPRHRLLRDEARTRIVDLLVRDNVLRTSALPGWLSTAQAKLDEGRPLDDALEAGRFLSELHTRREHYSTAVSVQQRMLSLQPNDPNRLEELAAAQRRAGQVESAMGTLEELLALDPSRGPDVLAEMSELAFEAGDSDRALRTATTAAEKDRSHVDAIVRLGEMHESKGDMDAAADAYRRALETKPTALRPKLRLAELELTRGNVARSRALLAEVLEASGPPELMEDAGRRALDLAEADGELAQALALAVRRCTQHPESAEPRRFLLDALDRLAVEDVTAWIEDGTPGDTTSADQRRQALRTPLLSSLRRGAITTRLRAAEQLGRLRLPGSARALALLGKNLAAPRDATATVQNAYEQARITALRSAGALGDPEATEALREVLGSSRHSWNARRTAAWALSRSDDASAVETLAPYLRLGTDTHIAALACLAMARHPSAGTAHADARVQVRQLATESRTIVVRHACTFAHASLLAPDGLDALRDDIDHSDPLVAAIAAWRVGSVGKAERPNVTPLLARALGPGGLARDAASAGLVRVLDPSQRARDDADPGFAPAPRGTGWEASLERWLQRRVVPSVEPIAPALLERHSEAVAEAIDAARTGTRAQRAALQKATARCDGASTDAFCIPTILTGPARIPN
ncbi:MAG: tetratricopeptide repeat protein [Nannocystaceae bacterium]|nr:tetratricopeptide repeat protein [bacterium]